MLPLLVARDAIAQIVEVFVLRAKIILNSLEAIDNIDVPVLDEDFLSGLMRQSMSLDLSDLMEEFTFEVESSPVSFGSQVALIDRKEAGAIARKARAAMRKALKELSEKENIPKWQNAIALWIEQHQGDQVSRFAATAILEYALGRSLALGCCIYLRLINGMGMGSFIGIQEIFGLAIDRDTPDLTLAISVSTSLDISLFNQ